MNRSQLAALEQTLCAARDLASVYSYFTDHFATDPELLAGGTPHRCPTLNSVVAQLSARYRRDATAFWIVAFAIDGSDFVHGVVDWGDWMALVFMFEQSGVGFIAAGPVATGPQMFARFRTVRGAHGIELMMN